MITKLLCTFCEDVKPVDQFSRQYSDSTKYYAWCNRCRYANRSKKSTSGAKATTADLWRIKPRRNTPSPAVDSKLTPDTVRLIRRLHEKGKTCAGIARGINVSRSAVSRIVNGKSYTDVK